MNLQDRFLALPVNKGDSFYLEREGHSVLVDGGGSGQVLCRHISDNNIKKIEVVICSHNDSDHAEGLIGLLKHGVCIVDEVWLPGRWGHRFIDICEDFDGFVDELFQELFLQKNNDFDVYLTDDEICFSNSSEVTGASRESAEFEIDRLLEQLDDSQYLKYSYPLSLTMMRKVCHRPDRKKIFLSAIDAANRIREIARSAYENNVKIRWFDYEEYQNNNKTPSGGVSWLKPLNSRELIRPKKKDISALHYLSLTTQNRECLAFWSPANQSTGDVLFLADSPVNFGLPNVTQKNVIIVTAPHHGSEKNARAYRDIQNWLRDKDLQPIWVRSDGFYFKRNPGNTYLNLQKNQRYCTVCRPKRERKLVSASAIGVSSTPSWIVNTPSSCDCEIL